MSWLKSEIVWRRQDFTWVLLCWQGGRGGFCLSSLSACQTGAGRGSLERSWVRATEGRQHTDDGPGAAESAETALRRSHSSTLRSDSVGLGVTSGGCLIVTSRRSHDWRDDVIHTPRAHTHTHTFPLHLHTLAKCTNVIPCLFFSGDEDVAVWKQVNLLSLSYSLLSLFNTYICILSYVLSSIFSYCVIYRYSVDIQYICPVPPAITFWPQGGATWTKT